MGQQPGDVMSLVGYHVLGRMSCHWSEVMSLVECHVLGKDVMSLV